MKVTAIIAEYNPIHSGHALHIDRARADSNADRIITVMSGDYVQRGCPALVSKYERARSALLAGADLVLELPIYYSTGSLEYFSLGAVSLLKETGIVNCISFGSECGDLSLLREAARLTSSLSEDENTKLKEMLALGFNYSYAINRVLDLPKDIDAILRQPNNLLAVSYIKAAHRLSFDCDFHTMKRAGAAYHDDSAGAVSSTAIRKDILTIYDKNDPAGLHDLLHNRMPDNIMDSLIMYLKEHPAMDEEALYLLLFYKLQLLTEGLKTEDAVTVLTGFHDVSPSLAGRIIGKYMHASSFNDLCNILKSRDINRTRISRALIHILLDIRKANMDEYVAGGYNYYIKPLAFKKEASDLMHAIKASSAIPIISKNADAQRLLNTPGLRMFNEGISASNLYNKAAHGSDGRPFRSEYERSIITL